MEAHPNQPILRPRREPLAIGRETDRADVQITFLGHAFVVERAAERAGAHVENLRRAVAPSRKPQPVLAEADTAHDALVVELVDEVDIERLRHAGVVQREPVIAILPVLGRHSGRIEVARELFFGTYNGRRRSRCRLGWEIVAATGGRLMHRRGRGWRSTVVVVCWGAPSDTTARRLLLFMFGTLGWDVQFTIIPALILAWVGWLLHRLQPAAAAAWRRSNGTISTLAHRNRRKRDTAHPEGRRWGCRVRAQVVNLGIETCDLILIVSPSLDCLGLNVGDCSAYA